MEGSYWSRSRDETRKHESKPACLTACLPYAHRCEDREGVAPLAAMREVAPGEPRTVRIVMEQMTTHSGCSRPDELPRKGASPVALVGCGRGVPPRRQRVRNCGGGR